MHYTCFRNKQLFYKKESIRKYLWNFLFMREMFTISKKILAKSRILKRKIWPSLYWKLISNKYSFTCTFHFYDDWINDSCTLSLYVGQKGFNNIKNKTETMYLPQDICLSKKKNWKWNMFMKNKRKLELPIWFSYENLISCTGI